MARTVTVRKYGRRVTRSRTESDFLQFPESLGEAVEPEDRVDDLDDITQQLLSVTLEDVHPLVIESAETSEPSILSSDGDSAGTTGQRLRVLTWDDICPFGDRIEKIAEASYAEVYRVSNERGLASSRLSG